MTAAIKNFITSESGAVTVDWVVLTAAIVGLGLAVTAVVSQGVENLGTEIRDGLATTAVSTPSFTVDPTTIPARE